MHDIHLYILICLILGTCDDVTQYFSFQLQKNTTC